MPMWLVYMAIGLVAGVSAGLFGIGGGIVVVPALIFWAGFSQQSAVGTSVAILLPPIGLAAALEYYRHGNVDVRAAVIIALTMFVGAWLGAFVANRFEEAVLRLFFALFICGVGVYLLVGALRRLL